MSKKLVSVIIPVYNVERYLERCLNSVISQTYKEIEILLINDGSTDKSIDICNSFASLDERVKVITQRNKGLSGARNTGIDNASGEYLLFVDSDDWIEKDMIESMMETSTGKTYDIVLCGYFQFYENEHFELKGLFNGYESFELNCDAAFNYLIEDNNISSHAWDKLFKASLFKDIRFPEGKNYEDVFIMHKIFLLANSFYHINCPKYYYYQRQDSICHVPSKKNMLDLTDCYLKRYEDVYSLLNGEQKIAILTKLKKNFTSFTKFTNLKDEFHNRTRVVDGICKSDKITVSKQVEILYVLAKQFPYLVRRLYSFRENKGYLYQILKHVVMNRRFKKEYNDDGNNKTKIVLLGVPEYNNLGDHAIAYAEFEFLKKYFTNYEIQIFSENEIRYNLNNLKKYISDKDILFLQGGGNIGDLYEDQNNLRSIIYSAFPNNKKVVMPSTVYFKHENNIHEIVDIFNNDNTLFFCREEYTYNFLKEYKEKFLHLVPDIVMSLPRVKNNKNGKVLMCIRSDIESSITFDNVCKIKDYFIQRGMKLVSIDTCLANNIPAANSAKEVTAIIKYFSEFDYVITDRLHGVIFSYIASTDCIPISNDNYKIRGIIKWISHSGKMLENTDQLSIDEYIKNLQPEKVELKYNFDNMYIIIRKFIGE